MKECISETIGEEKIPVCVDNAAIKAGILYSFYQQSGACLVGIKVYLHLGPAIRLHSTHDWVQTRYSS